MNRQEQLDIINQKIARIGGGTGPGETGYYLPIERNDVRNYIFDNYQDRPAYIQEDLEILSMLWKIKGEPLYKQSDECIEFVYSLLY